MDVKTINEMGVELRIFQRYFWAPAAMRGTQLFPMSLFT